MSPTLAGGFLTIETPGKPSFQSSTLKNSTVVFIVVHGSWCTCAGVSLGCILRWWFAEVWEYLPWLDIASVFFKRMDPVLTPANKVAVAVSLLHLLLSDLSLWGVWITGFSLHYPDYLGKLNCFHVCLTICFRELPVHIFVHFPAGLSSFYWVQDFL